MVAWHLVELHLFVLSHNTSVDLLIASIIEMGPSDCCLSHYLISLLHFALYDPLGRAGAKVLVLREALPLTTLAAACDGLDTEVDHCAANLHRLVVPWNEGCALSDKHQGAEL